MQYSKQTAGCRHLRGTRTILSKRSADVARGLTMGPIRGDDALRNGRCLAPLRICSFGFYVASGASRKRRRRSSPRSKRLSAWPLRAMI